MITGSPYSSGPIELSTPPSIKWYDGGFMLTDAITENITGNKILSYLSLPILVPVYLVVGAFVMAGIGLEQIRRSRF